jgi:hypothetical protein
MKRNLVTLSIGSLWLIALGIFQSTQSWANTPITADIAQQRTYLALSSVESARLMAGLDEEHRTGTTPFQKSIQTMAGALCKFHGFDEVIGFETADFEIGPPSEKQIWGLKQVSVQTHPSEPSRQYTLEVELKPRQLGVKFQHSSPTHVPFFEYGTMVPAHISQMSVRGHEEQTPYVWLRDGTSRVHLGYSSYTFIPHQVFSKLICEGVEEGVGATAVLNAFRRVTVSEMTLVLPDRGRRSLEEFAHPGTLWDSTGTAQEDSLIQWMAAFGQEAYL